MDHYFQTSDDIKEDAKAIKKINNQSKKQANSVKKQVATTGADKTAFNKDNVVSPTVSASKVTLTIGPSPGSMTLPCKSKPIIIISFSKRIVLSNSCKTKNIISTTLIILSINLIFILII